MNIDGVTKSNKREHSLKDIEMFVEFMCVLKSNDDIHKQKLTEN